MERRKFLFGIGTVAAGGAAAMGTGAFTSVEADRGVSVTVADDSGAFLALSESDGPNAAYAEVNGGELSVSLDAVNDNAETIVRDVFDITNNGTKDVYVWAEEPSSGELTEGSLSIFADATPNGDQDDWSLNAPAGNVDTSDPSDNLKLGPGDTMAEVGFIVRDDFDPSNYDGTITLVAKTEDEL